MSGGTYHDILLRTENFEYNIFVLELIYTKSFLCEP